MALALVGVLAACVLVSVIVSALSLKALRRPRAFTCATTPCATTPCATTPCATTTPVLQLYQLMKDWDQLACARGIPYVVEGGTLLGAVRNAGIIPHDDDLDINVPAKHVPDVLALQPTLRAWGYELGKCAFGYKLYPADGALVPGQTFRFPFLDIFVSHVEEDGKVYNECRCWPQCAFNIGDMYPAQRMRFGAFFVNAPAAPLPYLDACYGADWNDVYYVDASHLQEGQAHVRTKHAIQEADRRPATPLGPLLDRA